MPEKSDPNIMPSFKPENYIWLRRRLPIDTMDLGQEISDMPTLVQEAGEITSQAIEIREAAKEDVDRVIAQEADKLRNAPRPSGKARSETGIASEVFLSPLLESAQKELRVARLDASLWQTLTESMRRKDSAIRVIADLLNSGFLTSSSFTNKRRQEIRDVKV